MSDANACELSRREVLLKSLVAAAGFAVPTEKVVWAATEVAPGTTQSTTKAFNERYVTSANHRIYVRDYPGNEPAFLMLHGFPDNCRIYEDLALLLSKAGHRVVAFDFLGFGASDKPENFEYSFRQQMADVRAVVATLELASIIPVGHDAGGPAAVNFALDHPDQVAELVLLNCYYANSRVLAFPDFIELCCNPKTKLLAHAMMTDPQQAAYLFNFQQGLLLANMTPPMRVRFNTLLQPIIAQNFIQQPSAMPAFLAMTGDAYANLSANDRRVPEMAAFKKPVKLIWGVLDKYLNKAVAQDIAAHFPNASLTALEAEHWPQFDMPEAVAKAMLSTS